jgi:DNA mismatch endonuclease (patch repair protein)
MADVHDRLTRSKNMKAIKSSHTKPEMVFRKVLHANGYRFRLHKTELPGKPDLVLPKHRVAIFVNGCFWHRHGCYLFKWPGTNRKWWENKLNKTAERDAAMHERLIKQGWRVYVVWECSLRGKYRRDLSSVLSEFEVWLHGSESKGEISSLANPH